MSQQEVVYVHNYNPVTQEFIGSTPAYKSPLEEGVYLVPAHATMLSPPDITEGQKIIWDGEDWSVLDIPPDPAPTLEDILQNKIQELDILFFQKVSEGFSYEGNVFQIDDSSRLNMTAVMTDFALGATNPHGGFWRSKSNQMIQMTDSEVQTFIWAVKAYVLNLLQSYWTHKDAISGFETAEAVEGYDFSAGWPQN